VRQGLTLVAIAQIPKLEAVVLGARDKPLVVGSQRKRSYSILVPFQTTDFIPLIELPYSDGIIITRASPGTSNGSAAIPSYRHRMYSSDRSRKEWLLSQGKSPQLLAALQIPEIYCTFP
jgi:hypothetical protein